MWCNAKICAVSFQIILNILMRYERRQVGVKGKIRKHHHLLGKICSVQRKHNSYTSIRNAYSIGLFQYLCKQE